MMQKRKNFLRILLLNLTYFNSFDLLQEEKRNSLAEDSLLNLTTFNKKEDLESKQTNSSDRAVGY